MLLALLACWRPEPWTPPPPPAGEVGEAAPEAEGAPEGEDEGEPEGEADEPVTRFVSYRAHTLVSPVTIVDDWGKTLAVIPTPDWPLEVRGEEPIRKRVWCETCDPQVEGWVQPHLVAADSTDGSK